MTLPEKLSNFFIDNGVQKKWLADKVGMPSPYVHQIIKGTRTVSPQYWKKLIHYTRGTITLRDIIEHYLKNVEGLEVSEKRDGYECILSLQDIHI